MTNDVTSVTKSLDRIADALDSSDTDSGLTGSIKRIAKAIDSESDTKSITDSLDAIADYIEENGIGGGGSDDFVEVTITNSEESDLSVVIYCIGPDISSPDNNIFVDLVTTEVGIGETISAKVLANSKSPLISATEGGFISENSMLSILGGTAKVYEIEENGVTYLFPYFDEDGQNIVLKYSGD